MEGRSYVNMDHADWVQRQIGPTKARLRGAESRKESGWAVAPDQISEFQAKVFDILGIAFGGIYNAPIGWRGLQWHWGGGIAVPIGGNSLCTFDFGQLTMLVFLCHEARIRFGVEGYGMQGLLLTFYPRQRVGDIARRHPNLDEAVEAFRRHLPRDHRIAYRDPEPVEAEAANG